MSETSPSPPPARETTTSGVGKGYKYDYVRQILRGQEPELWIREQRERGKRESGKSTPYSEIAEELNRLIKQRDRNARVRVTLESIRRWDPDGEFARRAALDAEDRQR